MIDWADRWLADEAHPHVLTVTHRTCGATFHPEFTCTGCGDTLTRRSVRLLL
jgi:hypothetical protein